MEESTKIHLTISPHVAHPGEFVTMRITYSGGGGCGFASMCGPQGTNDISLLGVNCRTHKPLPPPIGPRDPQFVATTRCYEVTPASATGAPFYDVIVAPIGPCGATGGLGPHPFFDCVSADYLLIEPPCSSPAASGDPTCNRLDVTVKPVQQVQSGLDKTEEAFFGGPKDGCFSGCADLLVTVKDHRTHKPVSGAVVSASVTPISKDDIPQYPSGNPGDGYLCDQADPRSCGSGHLITGLKTNASGRLRLRYWAPGLIADGQMTVTAMARENCRQSGCPKSGEFTTNNITVRRNLIYRRDAALSATEAGELANWTESKLFEFGSKLSIEVSLNHALNALVKSERLAEHAAERLGEGLERVSGALEIAEVASALWQQQGFMALFFDKFSLSGTGLGRAPEDRVVSAAPSSSFQRVLSDDGIPPLHLGHKGLLWNYGAALAFLSEESNTPVGAQAIHLFVYEVSYCGQGEECGPNYHGSKGIHPFLEIQLVSDSAGRQDFDGAILTPYDARAWLDTQFGN
jgi:hypothetical protein